MKVKKKKDDAAGGDDVPAHLVEALAAMGIPESKAKKALKKSVIAIDIVI